jgi:hypothetical protein
MDTNLNNVVESLPKIGITVSDPGIDRTSGKSLNEMSYYRLGLTVWQWEFRGKSMSPFVESKGNKQI